MIYFRFYRKRLKLTYIDFIKATLRLGVDREDIGKDLRDWLKDFNKNI